MARDGGRSGHAEGKQEHHRQHMHRTGRRRCTLGLLHWEDGAGGGGNSIGDGHGALSLLLVVVVVTSLVVCGGGDGGSNVGHGRGALSLLLVLFDVVVVALLAVVDVVGRLAVVALLDRIGLVGVVALATTLVCWRMRTRVLGWGLDAGEVLLVVLLDGLQGVALETLRHPLLDLLLLGLAPGLELLLGLAVRCAHGRRRCRRLGLARNAHVVLAVLLLDGGLCEVLVGLRRVLVHAPEGLLAPRLQLLRGVAICGGCWR
mmetsp:Transcript_72507/g.204485  ORF Transcript_72507/g.204485 Transcript_72507/m.204485 type:complete len:260 (-) Transcript_72507:160-939(-)